MTTRKDTMVRQRFFKLIVLIFSIWTTIALAATPTIEKGPSDHRQYGYEVLQNGLKVVTVSDQKAHVNAISMLIGSGSYAEPNAWPGLAHYLEHMLFLGTEKYPDVDDFQSFLTQYGGSRNAMTANEFTQYFFTVQPKGLNGALDRFAQFFIAPLFTQERAEKERQAIDAEYKMNLAQDGMRWLEVDKETSNTKHPYRRFHVGNLKTLSGDNHAREQALKAYYQQHYVADNMFLVVVGPQSNSELARLVKQHFGPIEAKTLPQALEQPLIYDTAQKGLDIRVKTKGDVRQLLLHFPVPSQQDYYKEKPGHLLALILGDESKGSLLSALKKRNWAHSLSTEFSRVSDDQDRLTINIGLTPTGISHINDITQAVFNYVDFVAKKGYPQDYFESFKKVNRLNFTYAEYVQPLSMAIAIAQSSLRYPIEDLVTYPVLAKDTQLPGEKIQQLLTYLIPANLRRFVLSPEESGNQTSEWYQASYSVEKLPSTLRSGSSAQWQSAFAMPESNPYVPENIEMVKVQNRTNVPLLISDSPQLWFHQEDAFKVPKAEVRVNFVNPEASNTAKNTVLSSLFAMLVAEKLQEKMYPASMAGASLSLYAQARGLTLSLDSYSDKQKQILEAMLNEMLAHQIDAQQFYIQKDKLERSYKNFHQLRLFQKAFTDVGVLIENPKWHPDKLLAELGAITPVMVSDFAKKYFDNCHLEMLINGNTTQAKAKELSDHIAAMHTFKTDQQMVLPTQVVKLDGNYLWKIKHKEKEDLWAGYYQVLPDSLSSVAKTAALATLLQSPFYQQLRAQKQLGYALGVMPLVQNQVAGLVLWVQSPNTQPEAIQKHVDTFVQDILKDNDIWDAERLKSVQQSLVTEWQQPAKTLTEQSIRWWEQIEAGRTDFDRREKLIDEVQKFDAKQLQDFFASLMEPESSRLITVSRVEKGQFKELTMLSSFDDLINKGKFFD